MIGLGSIDDVYKHYLKVVDENQQLKELLKECRDYVVNALIELKNGYCYEENDYYHETKTLLTKIDNAIGEKKWVNSEKWWTTQ